MSEAAHSTPSTESTEAVTLVAEESQKLDPRIRRTRRMLREAMLSLLETELFDTISVQAIAERATVNRATFYSHYVDREALLEDVLRGRFEDLLETRHVRFDGTCPSALRVVILAVYDFLREMSSDLNEGCRKQQRHFDPYMQQVVQAEVEKVLYTGLANGAFQLGNRPSLVAAALSWAIYGAATSNLRSSESAPAEQFVEDVYNLLLPLLMPRTSPT